MKARDVMKRAWEIRREAANRIGCKVSEIHFGICLQDAWAEQKELRGYYEKSYAKVLNELRGYYEECMANGDKRSAMKNVELAREWKSVKDEGILRREWMQGFCFCGLAD